MSKTPPQAHKDICAHEPCECGVDKSDKYCSKECAEADAAGENDECPCPENHGEVRTSLEHTFPASDAPSYWASKPEEE